MIKPHYSDEVREAMQSNHPIVALESTIITHGMPFPQNLETARLVEEDIRSSGAVPATIAVIEGRLHIGLSASDLEGLAKAQNVAKLSRADLAVCISQGLRIAVVHAKSSWRTASIDASRSGGPSPSLRS